MKIMPTPPPQPQYPEYPGPNPRHIILFLSFLTAYQEIQALYVT
jgi:hypothetical protein